MIKKIIFLLVFISLAFSNTSIIKADDTEDLAQRINEYTQKLNELGTAKNTLANQIKILNSQYELTLLKINQTENSIKSLETEINNLTIEIGKLDVQLNELSSIYVLQIIQNYKLQKNIPPFAFLLSSRLNNFLSQYKYISNIQKNSQNTLINMETVRSNYDNQKKAKAQKQSELEQLKKTLASQKINLTNQKAAKNNLLETTKNDEKKYQQLLTEAQSQLAALKNFSSTYGSTCLSSSPSTGSDGNFFSQRDPRWCSQYIGLSRDTIGEVGCYISSLSMLYKKIGFNTTPSIYAADPSHFWSNTAYMLNPIPPANYVYKESLYNHNTIDNELRNGRYVIAQVRMDTVVGMHFIVIISGNNGNYKIHDPWFGPDQTFTDHYSTGLIISLRLVTK